MKSYTVISIDEPDYGCEERPDGYEKMDRVALRDENQEIIYMEISDAELYREKIDVGSKIQR